MGGGSSDQNMYINPELEVENIPTKIILKKLLSLHIHRAQMFDYKSSTENHCAIFSIQHAFCTEIE